MHSLLGELESCGAGEALGFARVLQHESRIGADTLVDVVEGSALGAPAVFDRRANYASRVSDEIRYDQNAASVQRRFCLRGAGNVGPLRHQPRLQPGDIVSPHNIWPGSGNPNVARHVQNRVDCELLSVAMLAQGFAARLESDQGIHVESIRIGYRPACVARCDQNRALLRNARHACPPRRSPARQHARL